MQTQIIFSESAAKKLKRLDLSLSKRFFESVSQLIENPEQKVIKLTGTPYFRLRSWEYQAIFDIQKNTLRILVIKIGHRRSINKK